MINFLYIAAIFKYTNVYGDILEYDHRLYKVYSGEKSDLIITGWFDKW